jgi:hypothetical protein
MLNSRSMKTLTIFFTLILVPVSFAQKPDRWRELVIDEATPEQAIDKLGKPDADKIDSFRVYKIEEKFTKEIRDKKYRRLEYKTIEGLSKVILAFNNNKLVFIELNPKKLDPNVLASAYGIEFTPTFDKIEKGLHPGNFEPGTGKQKAKSYPVFYYLYGAGPTTHVLAGVGNSSIGSVLGAKSINDDLDFPGHVAYVQIISKTLENKQNVEVLK